MNIEFNRWRMLKKLHLDMEYDYIQSLSVSGQLKGLSEFKRECEGKIAFEKKLLESSRTFLKHSRLFSAFTSSERKKQALRKWKNTKSLFPLMIKELEKDIRNLQFFYTNIPGTARCARR